MNKVDKCSVCNSQRDFSFGETVLNKYHVSYYSCATCGLLQTEEPYWLDESYNDPIAITDKVTKARIGLLTFGTDE